MPGIVGFITKMPRAWAEPQLIRMVNAMRHELFYRTGTWIDESLGVYVGWAERENSFADGMPLRNEKEDVVLVFSGEEYPAPNTAIRLKQQGHVLSSVPASYLVHLYEEDRHFPLGLNGRFHGVLVDRALGTAMLFNDRFGLHRLYYHESKDAFYFAAETKAILAVRPELRKVDPQSLGEFLTCGCVLENRTLFERIHLLPQGAAWRLRDGSVSQKVTYFHPSSWENQAPLESEPYYLQLRTVFAKNLPRYFNGTQPVGVSLTGGLDTRMIMAWKRSQESLPCYSFSGMYRNSRDVIVARRVAAACQQPHQDIPVGDEFKTRFPYYAERTVYLTDGCADVSCSPILYTNERARQIAPVKMTGNYGGEVLRRVRAFKPHEPLPGLFCGELHQYVNQARVTYAEVIQTHPLSFAVFRQAPWHHYGLLALEQTQLAMRSPYLDNDFLQTVFRAPESACVSDDVCLRLIADGNARLRGMRTDRGLGGNGGRLSAKLARNLLEFSFKAEYAYDYGMPQWVAQLDYLCSPLHLERLFLGRHKYYHFRVWYRDTLAWYVREILLDPKTLSRPFLERTTVESIVKGHLKGNRNYTTSIHQLLTLELLHRLFLDPQ